MSQRVIAAWRARWARVKEPPAAPTRADDFSQDGPAVRVAAISLARRIHLLGRRFIGLLPVDSNVAATPSGLRLGRALIELIGEPVAYFDAHPLRPGLPERVAATEHAPVERGPYTAMRWLERKLAVFHLERTQLGNAAEILEIVLGEERARNRFAYVLVDLTGYRETGDYSSLVKLLDGVFIVARAHHSLEYELLDVAATLPAKRNLGVILIGGKVE